MLCETVNSESLSSSFGAFNHLLCFAFYCLVFPSENKGIPELSRFISFSSHAWNHFFLISGIKYLPGGVKSGFRHVDPEDVQKRLFQVVRNYMIDYDMIIIIYYYYFAKVSVLRVFFSRLGEGQAADQGEGGRAERILPQQGRLLRAGNYFSFP